MEDLTFLHERALLPTQALVDSAAELATLSTLADDRRGDELVRLTKALFDAGRFDVRVVAFYLWGVVQLHGLAQVGPVIDTLTVLAASDFAGYGPEQQRAQHAGRRFAWLLKKIGEELDYHRVKETPAWAAWLEAHGDAPIEALERFAPHLQGALAVCAPALPELTNCLRLVQQRLTQQRATQAVSAADALGAPSVPEERAPASPSSVASRPPLGSGSVELHASASFFDLVERMRAFTTLIERGDVLRAAVVGDDLSRTIENFDPRVYFPEVFSEFSRLLSQHIDALAQAWEERDTIAWKARAQYYQVDLKRFVTGS